MEPETSTIKRYSRGTTASAGHPGRRLQHHKKEILILVGIQEQARFNLVAAQGIAQDKIPVAGRFAGP